MTQGYNQSKYSKVEYSQRRKTSKKESNTGPIQAEQLKTEERLGMDIRILHDFGKIFCLKKMGRIVYRSCIEINLDIIKKRNQLRYNNILSKFHSHHTQMPQNFIGTFPKKKKKKEEFCWETRILITYSYTKTSSLELALIYYL